jgi:hypothetical protein
MEISRKRSVDAKLDLARHYAPGRRAREGRFRRSLERRGRRDKIGRTPMLRPPLSVAAAVVALGASLHASQNTPQAVPEDFVIKLERTSCFGPCPVYSVTIDGKGNVTYEGKKFVRVPGRQADQIPVSRVAELVATIDRIRFFELNDEYRVIRNADGTTTMVSDLPTTFITVTRDGQTKSIEDYVGAPEPLHQLEKEIDEAARTKRWIFLDQATLRQQKSGRSFSFTLYLPTNTGTVGDWSAVTHAGSILSGSR